MELNTEWCTEDIDNYANVGTIMRSLERSNKAYLNNHPEIRAILRVLLQNAVEKQPQNVYTYAADLFNCSKTPLIIELINKQLKIVKNLTENGKFLEFDADAIVNKSGSTHSLQSQESITANNEALLRYAPVFPTLDDCGK